MVDEKESFCCFKWSWRVVGWRCEGNGGGRSDRWEAVVMMVDPFGGVGGPGDEEMV